MDVIQLSGFLVVGMTGGEFALLFAIPASARGRRKGFRGHAPLLAVCGGIASLAAVNALVRCAGCSYKGEI